MFLEAIVTLFKVAREDVAQLIYPTALLIAGVAILLGLGGYQRLSAAAETKVEAADDRDEAATKA